MKKIKRIPTLIGIFFLLAGTGATLLLLQRGTSWFLKASPESTPKQVSVTNITADGFNISWITDEASSGLVKYGPEGSLTLTAKEEGDEASKTTHYVILKNLQPATVYHFKIISDEKLFDHDGRPYETTTAPELKASIPPSDIAYGKVVDANGQPAAGAIVYLSLANVSPLSAYTKSAGTWMIPLNLARSADLSSFAAYDKEASVEEILVTGGNNQNATVVTTTGHDSPVPDIVLGKNVDLRLADPDSNDDQMKAEDGDPDILPNETPTAGSSGFEVEERANDADDAGQELLILNPDPGETIDTQLPLFVGQGPAGEELEIVVESDDPQSGTATPNDQGEWQWSPPSPLDPGEHTVTVSYTDINGQKHSLKRTFVVLAASDDSLPALSSSPSGQVPTPTLVLSPTPVASPTGRYGLPTTESGVPASGQFTPTLIVMFAGIGLLLMGTLTYRRTSKEGNL